MTTLPCGRWEVPHGEARADRLGFLMLDGLLARDLILAGTTCTELLGEGDVLQPWVATREDGLVRYHVLWHVLSPVRLAVLDEQFARSLAQWPQVMSALLERAVRRTHADVDPPGAAPALAASRRGCSCCSGTSPSAGAA